MAILYTVGIICLSCVEPNQSSITMFYMNACAYILTLTTKHACKMSLQYFDYKPTSILRPSYYKTLLL